MAPPQRPAIAFRSTRIFAVLLALLMIWPLSGPIDRARAAPSCGLSAKLVPTCGVLTGAFVEPRGKETPTSAFKRFESQVGEKQQILHYFHVGNKLFPTKWQISMASGGRTLLLNWKPEMGHTWAQVANGAVDRQIDRQAAYIKSHYQQKFFLTIHHEPEDEVVARSGSGFTAADYRRMYQHVVKRFRAKGVTNVVFVMTYMGAQKHVNQPWFKKLWPGDRYVDWIAYDPYVTPRTNGQDGGFHWLVNTHWGSDFDGMYNWIAANHPNKPLMFTEWGVAEKPGSPAYKANLFRSVPKNLDRYPKIKAMVYFDAPNARSGRVQVDTSSSSLRAYRTMLDGITPGRAPAPRLPADRTEG